MTLALVLLATLFVAYANGANDNFKGVATLFGSGTSGYRRALAWATITTFAGALTATYLAVALVKRFSGKGLVPEALTTDPSFLAAVGLAAAATVLLATFLGMPVSTTHALMGGLVGAGLVRAWGAVQFAVLAKVFVLPLALSPFLAAAAAALLYLPLRVLRARFSLVPESCLCASSESVVLSSAGGAATATVGRRLAVVSGTTHSCGQSGVALRAQAALDAGHWISAGTLSFARGLNDAPKIVALSVAFGALSAGASLATVAVVMALGGLVNAGRVAQTMSRRITTMNAGQGFSANFVSSILVLAASRFGLPVSTTHVSCGALFGIGAVTGQARLRTILQIATAWVTTLPLAVALGALASWTLRP